jgi:CRP-like cAMP-binding protein
LWEVLRISVWRPLAPGVAIIREGEVNRLFGIVVDGQVEVSIAGSTLCRLGAGSVAGEVAYLHPAKDERSASVVTLEQTLFLEINAAALALASEELQERMRTALLAQLIDRMRIANRIAAAHGAPAVDSQKALRQATAGAPPAAGLDLELAD